MKKKQFNGIKAINIEKNIEKSYSKSPKAKATSPIKLKDRKDNDDKFYSNFHTISIQEQKILLTSIESKKIEEEEEEDEEEDEYISDKSNENESDYESDYNDVKKNKLITTQNIRNIQSSKIVTNYRDDLFKLSSKKVNELKPILEIENNEDEKGTLKVNRNFQRLKTFNDNLSDFTVNKLKQQLLDNAILNENSKLKKKKKKKKKIDELKLGKKLDDILSKSNNKNKNSNNNDNNTKKEKSKNNQITTIESDNKKDKNKNKNKNRNDSNDNCKYNI